MICPISCCDLWRYLADVLADELPCGALDNPWATVCCADVLDRSSRENHQYGRKTKTNPVVLVNGRRVDRARGVSVERRSGLQIDDDRIHQLPDVSNNLRPAGVGQ